MGFAFSGCLMVVVCCKRRICAIGTHTELSWKCTNCVRGEVAHTALCGLSVGQFAAIFFQRGGGYGAAGFRLPEVVDKFGKAGLGAEVGHDDAFLWVGGLRQPENMEG